MPLVQRGGEGTRAGECRQCRTFCDKLIEPRGCVEMGCPYLYSYTDELSGRRYLGCLQKVFGCEIDVEAFAARCFRPRFLRRRAFSTCLRSSFVSRITGTSSNRGSERKVARPSRPISPSPSVAWRSRFAPSGTAEALTCRQRSRSSPISPSRSSRRSESV